MNFGNVGLLELAFVVMAWGIPIVLVVWFVITLAAISRSLHHIAARMASLERALRDLTSDLSR